MINIKLTEQYSDNPIYNDNSFCKCKKKIIRKPNYFDPMELIKDMDKIVDDWRYMRLSEEDLAEVNKILRNKDKDKNMQINHEFSGIK